MGEKYPRWTYVVVFALLVIVVVLSVRALRGKRSQSVAVPPTETAARAPQNDEKTVRRDAENERRIDELNNEIAALRKQNEENAGRVQELESKLAESSKALAAAQQKLKVAQRQTERPAVAASNRDKALASRTPSPPASPPRRVDEAGAYEVIRDSALLEKPSTSSREVALVQQGMIVNVVASVGDWLEVRSKHGKPPGYIRRQDVTPKQVQADNRDRF